MPTGCPKREYKKCSAVLPIDAAWEQVDASRQDVLVRTCKARALELYLFVLKHASIEYVTGQGMTAVFSCRCLRDLSGAECGSYDFIARTISIFGALGLAQHYHRTPSGTRIHLPLGPYQAPTSLDGLNNLMSQHRLKLCRLAASTRKRYIYHYGDPENSSYPATIQQLKDTCQQLLQGQLTRETMQLLTAQINTLSSYFQDPAAKGNPGRPEQKIYTDHESHSSSCHPSRVTHTGDSHPIKGDLEWTIPTEKGDSAGTKGDLPVQALIPKGDLPTQKGDPVVDKGRPEVTKGDLKSPLNAEKGDPSDVLEHEQGYSEDFKATRVTPVSIIDDNNLLLSNNNYLSNDTIIDKETAQRLKNSTSERKSQIQQIRKEAEALVFFVEKNPRNLPSYINKLSKNPRATRAAVIDLLVHTHHPDYRGKPRTPGAWVNKAYERYDCLDPVISDEILFWLNTQASWEEIDHALRLEAEQRSQPPAPSSNDTSILTDHVSGRSTGCTTITPLDPKKGWMNEAEAHALAQQVVRDAAELGYTITSEVESEYAVWLVRINWDGNTLPIKSPDHWRKELAEICGMLQAKLLIPA